MQTLAISAAHPNNTQVVFALRNGWVATKGDIILNFFFPIQRSGWKDYLLWVCFFLTTIPIAALWEGCWSLSQLHTGEGREHPWKRVRRLAHGCLSSCSGTSPAISTPSKRPKPGIEPEAFTSHHHCPIYCVVQFFLVFFLNYITNIFWKCGFFCLS